MDSLKENRILAERVSQFQTMAVKKNSAVGDSLENVTIQLLKCHYSLKEATRADLLKLTGNKRIVGYLLRIFDDEPLESVLEDVNLTKSGRIRLPDDIQKKIEAKKVVKGIPTPDGAYENGVRALEDRTY